MKRDEKGGIKLVVGHYGSGKTEFAINYSLQKAAEGKTILLADLDIVNPFFRSRDRKDYLEKQGITVIGSSLQDGVWADIPALSPQIFSLFADTPSEKIVDVGGDPAGARVLSRFYEKLDGCRYEMWMVVNANRPETGKQDQVVRFLREIENISRLKVSGLINNTHMAGETKIEDMVKGSALCRQVSDCTGIPVRFTCVPAGLAPRLPVEPEGEIIEMKRYLEAIWLGGGNKTCQR